MIANYKAFVDRMIARYEGGYGWDRTDPGGPTKYGITCYDLAMHRGQRMSSMSAWAPICKAMPMSDAEEIYRSKYATAVRFDELASGIDCCWLDYAVNSGIGRPIRVAQKLLGVAVDGIFGRNTMGALVTYKGDFIADMCAERMRFLKALRIWRTFGLGWTRRVNDLQHYCHSLVEMTTMPVEAVAMKPEVLIDPSQMAKAYKSTVWSRIDYHMGNTETPFIQVPVTEITDDAREYTKGGLPS